MEGVIVDFRGGKRTQTNHHMVVKVAAITKRDQVATILKRKVEWKSPAGRPIAGYVAAPHGNNGAVRVIFEKGMPGQSIGQKVTIN